MSTETTKDTATDVACSECWSLNFIKNGKIWEIQKYKCKDCWSNFSNTSIALKKKNQSQDTVEESKEDTKKNEDSTSVKTSKKIEKKEKPVKVEKPKKEKSILTPEEKKSLHTKKFDEVKKSKKMWFEFWSWDEYHSKRSKFLQWKKRTLK